jgi:hypothetical protein
MTAKFGARAETPKEAEQLILKVASIICEEEGIEAKSDFMRRPQIRCIVDGAGLRPCEPMIAATARPISGNDRLRSEECRGPNGQNATVTVRGLKKRHRNSLQLPRGLGRVGQGKAWKMWANHWYVTVAPCVVACFVGRCTERRVEPNRSDSFRR